MKNLKMKLISFTALFFIVAAVIVSCNKADIDEQITETNSNASNNQLQSKTPSEYDNIFNSVIEAVAYGLVDLSKNPSFRTIVSQEVGLQFDGDDNVLLKKVNEACLNIGIDLEQEMTNCLTRQNKTNLIEYLDDAIDGFEYYDTKLFPQVIIPFIENINLQSQPAIALNYDLEEDLQSILITATNEEIFTANETFAQNNLVWVVSMNESVNTDGNVEKGNTKVGGEKSRAINRVLEVEQINVITKNEPWGNGRADISFAGVHLKSNCVKLNIQSLPMMKVADADINNGHWLFPSASQCFSCGTNTFTDASFVPNTLWEETLNEEIRVVFFEKDINQQWAKTVVLNQQSCIAPSTVNIVSKEPVYGHINPWRTNYPNYSASYEQIHLGGLVLKLKGQKIL